MDKTIVDVWTDDQIDDSEFISAIKYLVETDVIIIDSKSTNTDNQKLENKIKELESQVKDLESAEKTLQKSNALLLPNNNKLDDEISSLNSQIIDLHKSKSVQTDSSKSSNNADSSSDNIENGISDLSCSRGSFGLASINARFTSDRDYSSVFFDGILLDENRNIIEASLGSISNIQAGQTKFFTIPFFTSNFHSCEVQINDVYR